MKDGSLPNFSDIANQGVETILESVVPTQSVPAWPSFNSGKNPGKHGLFAFNEDVKHENEHLIDSRDLESHRFWDVLADDGITPAIVAAVQTYPPRNLERGFEVSGSQTPEDADVFSRPEEISGEIRDAVPDYSFGPDLSGSRNEIQSSCLESVENRAEVSRFLMSEKEWDYYSVVFRATDSAQHKLWDTPKMIRPVFERVDEFLGWVRSEFPDANIIVGSDHGFSDPPERVFFLDTWLSKQYDDSDYGSTPARKYSLAKQGYSLIRRRTGINIRNLLPESMELWATESSNGESKSPIRSAKNTHFDGVWISDSIEDYDGVRSKIIEDLLALKDPKTGQSVVRNAWKREEKYSGEWLSKIPDIVILPYPEFTINPNPYTDVFKPFREDVNEGLHDAALDGILLAAGPKIDSVAVTDTPSLLDIPPTILQLFQTPVPGDFDGKVLTEILKTTTANGSIQMQSPLSYEPPTTEERAHRKGIEDRLEDLGYL